MKPLCLDTNALVGWWEYWYPPTKTTYWEAFEAFGKKYPVCVSQEVYKELNLWPELAKWMQERHETFLTPNSDDIDAKVGEIVNTYKARLRLTAYENNADLYVVGLAALLGGNVMTDEREARRRRDSGDLDQHTKFRIPELCNRMGVTKRRSYEIIHMVNWRFEWDGKL